MAPLGGRPRARRRPTAQDLRNARVQAQQYASQGAAVKRQVDRAKVVQHIVKAWEKKAPAPARTRAPARPAPQLAPTYREATLGQAPKLQAPPPVKLTPTQRAREFERQYKSQGKAIEKAATVEPVLRDLNRYANKPVSQRRAQLQTIKNTAPKQRTESQKQVLALHQMRRRADVKMRERVGFLPRVKYGYTPKVTKINRMPTGDRFAKAMEQASPELRAALGTNPKLKRQLSSSLASNTVGEALGQLKTRKEMRKSAELAPATNVLEQASRPLYAVGGAAVEDVKAIQAKGLGHYLAHGGGKEALRAAGKGVTLKEHKTGSDVLKQAGVKNKLARAVGGFAFDVAADPFTYLTGGTTSIAREAAGTAARTTARAAERSAAREFAPRVAAKEITKREAKIEARRIGQREGQKAYKQRIERATDVEHRRVFAPTVRGRAPLPYVKARAKGKQAQSQIAAKLGSTLAKTERGKRVVEGTRAQRVQWRRRASEINAQVRPPGISQEKWERGREIDRSRRAIEESISRQGADRAVTLAKLITPEQGKQIREAIERNDLESLKGKAPKATLGRADRLNPRGKRLRQMAEDPDRFYKLAKATTGEWKELRGKLRELGVDVGHIGERAPVKLPELTANVKGAQEGLAQAGRQLSRAQRDLLEHQAPGVRPGKLTDAQVVRATRELDSAQQAKAAALDAFRRAKRIEKSAQSPAVKKTMRARARSARGRASQAQQRIDHWSHQAGRETRATKPVLAPVEGTPALEVTRAAAPPRATIPVAKRQVREAKGALARTKAQARQERSALHTAVKAEIKRREGAKGYVPRIPKEQVEERGRVLSEQELLQGEARRVGGGGGVRKPQPGPTLKRGETRPLEALERSPHAAEREYAGQFSHDFGLVHQAYTAAMGRGIGRAHANQQLLREGRAVEHGQPLKLDENTEALYHAKGAHITPVDRASTEGKQIIRDLQTGDLPRDGRYVVLNKALADHVTRSTTHEVGEFGRFWDRAFGMWKRVALGTPAYIVRNAFSDLFAAYGAQDPARLAANYIRAQRGLSEHARVQRGYRLFEDEMEKAGKGNSTTINGLPMRYRDLVAEAEAAGAVGAGRVLDAMQQLQQTRKHGGLTKPKGLRAWDRVVERVENSARLATYIGHRQRGLSPEEAAGQVAKIHFDYGELTKREKGLRRGMPFYTFTARNIPRQAQLLATRPGKLLAYDKARQEAVKSLQGQLPEDYVAGLDPFEARQLGIPLKLPGGGIATVSAGLPITDLNDVVPADLSSAKGWASMPVTTITRRGVELVGPYKAIPELVFNYSAFFRDQIENPDSPRTPIPGPIETMTRNNPALKKAWGISPKVDPTTGKVVEQWPKRLDYAVKNSLPGAFGAFWRLTYGSKPTARGFPHWAEAAGSLTGIRAKPLDLKQNEINKLYNQQTELKARKRVYNDAGITKDNPEGKHLTAEQKARIRLKDFPKVMDDLSKVAARIEEIQSGRQKYHHGRFQAPGGRVASALAPGRLPVITKLPAAASGRLPVVR